MPAEFPVAQEIPLTRPLGRKWGMDIGTWLMGAPLPAMDEGIRNGAGRVQRLAPSAIAVLFLAILIALTSLSWMGTPN